MSEIDNDLTSTDWGGGPQVIYDSQDREIAQVGYFGGGSEAGYRESGDQDEERNEAYARLFTKSPALLSSLKEIAKEYRAWRDTFYDGVTDRYGRFADPDDERAVAEMDAIIDRAFAAIDDASTEA